MLLFSLKGRIARICCYTTLFFINSLSLSIICRRTQLSAQLGEMKIKELIWAREHYIFVTQLLLQLSSTEYKIYTPVELTGVRARTLWARANFFYNQTLCFSSVWKKKCNMPPKMCRKKKWDFFKHFARLEKKKGENPMHCWK